MKIALIAPSQIPSRRANTLQVMKMAQAMTVLGNDVRLAAPLAGSRKPPAGGISSTDWQELARHYGLQHSFPVFSLFAAPRWRRYDYGYRSVAWARGWGADLLYSRLPQAAAISSLLGMPTILETHDFPQGRAGRLLFRAFISGRGRRRLVLITRSLAQDLSAKQGVSAELPFTIIAPDGVDLARYANLPDARQARGSLRVEYGVPVDVDRILVGYTGHLYRGRGANQMLKMAALLPEVNFLLVGGEPDHVADLTEKVEQHNLRNVMMIGFVPNADLPAYQAACDMLLMPYQAQVAASSGGDISRYLSPMKLFEYLACGRPILSGDLPVLREVLNPSNSVLLPLDDLETWAAAIRDLAADPNRRSLLGEQARLDASHYTWDERARKILEGL